MICHLPLRKRLGSRGGSFSGPFELLGHAESIRQDPAPSCGELRNKNSQRSAGSWMQHPQGQIWFCAVVFSTVTVLLILVLALSLKLFLN